MRDHQRDQGAEASRCCDRCGRVIERVPGQLGRTPSLHLACMTPAETVEALRLRNRLYSQHRRNVERAVARAAAADVVPGPGSPAALYRLERARRDARIAAVIAEARADFEATEARASRKSFVVSDRGVARARAMAKSRRARHG